MIDALDTRKLRMFVTTVREGSMRRASKILSVTPSALSHGIQSLESGIGTRLLERNGPKISPSPIGWKLFHEAVDILSRLEDAAARFSENGQTQKEQLSVGLTNIGCSHLFPAIIREFRESCPQVSLKLEIGETDHLLNRLNERRIDLAIGPFQRDYSDLIQTQIGNDELVYIVHPSHSWAGETRITKAHIAKQPLIIPSADSATYSLIDARYRELRLPLKHFVELNDEDGIKQLVCLNMGTGIVPGWIAREEIRDGRLVAFPMPRRPLERRWTIVHHPILPRNMADHLFVATAAAVAQSLLRTVPLKARTV